MSIYDDFNRYDFCPNDPGYPDGHHHKDHYTPCPTLSRIRRVNTRTLGGGIIPFASDAYTPIILTTLAGALFSNATLVAFGTSVSGFPLSNNGTTLTIPAVTGNDAFSMPRSGVITSIAANFTVTTAVTLTTPVTIVAQLFRANSSTFTAIPGASVNLGLLQGSLSVGDSVSGIANFAAPVDAGTRVMMVFYATNPTGVASTIRGYANAGTEIK
ncbi:exosporium glycoprotein BclB-related protein [Clostridium fungisolvens]|uniref:BclB C-terminal domain-containing protein n=1 Tax=Clostridium fungisolvens TaxID=1604897 RepID=A0A6V8SMN2_9CLOT|nr:exosporium glycoprotein BclB-related protein [Clostridium fungisolvens]GFP78130.1 hypothetical protein bsdtw1_04324 [Clostridium fungisolvens]